MTNLNTTHILKSKILKKISNQRLPIFSPSDLIILEENLLESSIIKERGGERKSIIPKNTHTYILLIYTENIYIFKSKH